MGLKVASVFASPANQGAFVRVELREERSKPILVRLTLRDVDPDSVEFTEDEISFAEPGGDNQARLHLYFSESVR